MKRSHRRLSFQFLFAASLFFIADAVNGQLPTHTAIKNDGIDPNINLYWEYLPRNYASDNDSRYPLIIWIHGYGESGSGHSGSIPGLVLNSSLPRLISENRFPESFISGNKTMRFIVLSPQIKDGIDIPTRSSKILPATIDAMIDHAIKTYRVDVGRIYLCGMSMGGGAVLDYLGSGAIAARKIAAAVITCPASDLSVPEADVLGSVGVPLVLTHNRADELVFYNRSVASINNLNTQLDHATAAPIFVTFEQASPDPEKHNSWTRTFEQLAPGADNDPNVINTIGTNVYEWLLKFTTVTDAPVPVRWQSFGLRKTSFGLMAEWSVSQQVNVASYNVQRSTNGVQWINTGSLRAIPGNGLEWYYQFTDSVMPVVATQYRVQSVDVDGNTGYTVAKTYRPDNATAALFSVFPNPFGSRITINFEKQAGRSLRVALYNASGLLVDLKYIQTAGRAGRFDMNSTAALGRGLYFLHITTEDGTRLFNTALIKKD